MNHVQASVSERERKVPESHSDFTQGLGLDSRVPFRNVRKKEKKKEKSHKAYITWEFVTCCLAWRFMHVAA